MAAVLKSVDDTITKVRELNQFITEGYQVTKGIAEDCEDDENGKDIVNDLRNIMVSYATMERDLAQYSSAAQTALGKFRTKYAATGDDEKVPDLYGLFEETLRGIQDKNTDEEIQQSKEVVEFTQTVWSVHNPDPQSTIQTTDVSKMDEEVEISQIDDASRFICPITKLELVDPVKSKLCGHTYSRKAIEAHINSMRTRAKCPIPGCVSAVVITTGDLEANNILAFELRKRNKKM